MTNSTKKSKKSSFDSQKAFQYMQKNEFLHVNYNYKTFYNFESQFPNSPDINSANTNQLQFTNKTLNKNLITLCRLFFFKANNTSKLLKVNLTHNNNLECEKHQKINTEFGSNTSPNVSTTSPIVSINSTGVTASKPNASRLALDSKVGAYGVGLKEQYTSFVTCNSINRSSLKYNFLQKLLITRPIQEMSYDKDQKPSSLLAEKYPGVLPRQSILAPNQKELLKKRIEFSIEKLLIMTGQSTTLLEPESNIITPQFRSSLLNQQKKNILSSQRNQIAFFKGPMGMKKSFLGYWLFPFLGLASLLPISNGVVANRSVEFLGSLDVSSQNLQGHTVTENLLQELVFNSGKSYPIRAFWNTYPSSLVGSSMLQTNSVKKESLELARFYLKNIITNNNTRYSTHNSKLTNNDIKIGPFINLVNQEIIAKNLKQYNTVWYSMDYYPTVKSAPLKKVTIQKNLNTVFSYKTSRTIETSISSLSTKNDSENLFSIGISDPMESERIIYGETPRKQLVSSDTLKQRQIILIAGMYENLKTKQTTDENLAKKTGEQNIKINENGKHISIISPIENSFFDFVYESKEQEAQAKKKVSNETQKTQGLKKALLMFKQQRLKADSIPSSSELAHSKNATGTNLKLSELQKAKIHFLEKNTSHADNTKRLLLSQETVRTPLGAPKLPLFAISSLSNRSSRTGTFLNTLDSKQTKSSLPIDNTSADKANFTFEATENAQGGEKKLKNLKQTELLTVFDNLVKTLNWYNLTLEPFKLLKIEESMTKIPVESLSEQFLPSPLTWSRTNLFFVPENLNLIKFLQLQKTLGQSVQSKNHLNNENSTLGQESQIEKSERIHGLSPNHRKVQTRTFKRAFRADYNIDAAFSLLEIEKHERPTYFFNGNTELNALGPNRRESEIGLDLHSKDRSYLSNLTTRDSFLFTKSTVALNQGLNSKDNENPIQPITIKSPLITASLWVDFTKPLEGPNDSNLTTRVKSNYIPLNSNQLTFGYGSEVNVPDESPYHSRNEQTTKNVASRSLSQELPLQNRSSSKDYAFSTYINFILGQLNHNIKILVSQTGSWLGPLSVKEVPYSFITRQIVQELTPSEVKKQEQYTNTQIKTNLDYKLSGVLYEHQREVNHKNKKTIELQIAKVLQHKKFHFFPDLVKHPQSKRGNEGTDSKTSNKINMPVPASEIRFNGPLSKDSLQKDIARYASGKKDIQKKRKAKKLRLESRRQKKRKRFYPRPIWLRYRLGLRLSPRSFAIGDTQVKDRSFNLNKRFLALETVKGHVDTTPQILPKTFSISNFNSLVRAANRTIEKPVQFVGATKPSKWLELVNLKTYNQILYNAPYRLHVGKLTDTNTSQKDGSSSKTRLLEKNRVTKPQHKNFLYNEHLLTTKSLVTIKNNAKYSILENKTPNQNPKKDQNNTIFKDFWIWLYNLSDTNQYNKTILFDTILRNLSLTEALSSAGGKFGSSESNKTVTGAEGGHPQSTSARRNRGEKTITHSSLLNETAYKRIYWSLHKTNLWSKTNKRLPLWASQKLRNQSKNNKTKYLEKQLKKQILNSLSPFFARKPFYVGNQANEDFWTGGRQKIPTTSSAVHQPLNSGDLSAGSERMNPRILTAGINSKIENSLKYRISLKLHQKETKLAFLTTLNRANNSLNDFLSIKTIQPKEFVSKPSLPITGLTSKNTSNSVWWSQISPLYPANRMGYLDAGFLMTEAPLPWVTKNQSFQSVAWPVDTQSTSWIGIFFHCCALISLLSISQIRCFIKFHLILIHKLSNFYLQLFYRPAQKAYKNLTKIGALNHIFNLALGPVRENNISSLLGSLNSNKRNSGLKPNPIRQELSLEAGTNKSSNYSKKLRFLTVRKLSLPGIHSPQSLTSKVDPSWAGTFSSQPNSTLRNKRTTVELETVFKEIIGNKKFFSIISTQQNKLDVRNNKQAINLRLTNLIDPLGAIDPASLRESPEDLLPRRNRPVTRKLTSLSPKAFPEGPKRLIALFRMFREIKLLNVKTNSRGVLQTASTVQAPNELKIMSLEKQIQLYEFSKLTTNNVKKETLNLSFKVVDTFESFLRLVYSFFEKPAEFTMDWIAYAFLVEWSSNILSFTPQNNETKNWLAFSKIVKQNQLTSLFYNLNSFSLLTRGNSLAITLDSKQSSNIGSLNMTINNFGPFALMSTLTINQFLTKRVLAFNDMLLAVLYRPDTDLMNRQKKGTLFWDIWSDYLIKAADKYNINVPSLSNIKEEQNLLLEYFLASDSTQKDKKGAKSINRDRRQKGLEDGSSSVGRDTKKLGRESKSRKEFDKLQSTRDDILRYGAFKPTPYGWGSDQEQGQSQSSKEAEFKIYGLILDSPDFNSFLTQSIYERRFGKSIDGLQTVKRLTFISNALAQKERLISKYNSKTTSLISETYRDTSLLNQPHTTEVRFKVNNLGETNTTDFNLSQQFVTYQSKETDLFLDYHPPKSFTHISAIKYYSIVQQPIGMLVCQIYSGILNKQIAKNVLVIGSTLSSNLASGTNASGVSGGEAQSMQKTLLIQALAGETEIKIITDNASRYAIVNRGFAVGIKYLKEVFEAITLNTPCLFLLEDIHLIGERRPLLISDQGDSFGSTDGMNKSTESAFGSQRTGEAVHEKNQIYYQLSRHSITHYKKPFKGDFSLTLPTNHFSFDLFLKSRHNNYASTPTHPLAYGINIFSNNALGTQDSGKSNLSLVTNTKILSPRNLKSLTGTSNPENQSLNSNNGRRSSVLQLEFDKNTLISAPSTSPFSVLLLKEQKKLKPKKRVKELPWAGLPTEQLALLPRVSYSVRSKVAALAELGFTNMSAKLDMITDLLVIIDSVRGNRGFVVFATTHLPHILDPALRRPGRLDETISIPTLSNLWTRWEFSKSYSHIIGLIPMSQKPFNWKLESMLSTTPSLIAQQKNNFPLTNPNSWLQFGPIFRSSISNTQTSFSVGGNADYNSFKGTLSNLDFLNLDLLANTNTNYLFNPILKGFTKIQKNNLPSFDNNINISNQKFTAHSRTYTFGLESSNQKQATIESNSDRLGVSPKQLGYTRAFGIESDLNNSYRRQLMTLTKNKKGTIKIKHIAYNQIGKKLFSTPIYNSKTFTFNLSSFSPIYLNTTTYGSTITLSEANEFILTYGPESLKYKSIFSSPHHIVNLLMGLIGGKFTESFAFKTLPISSGRGFAAPSGNFENSFSGYRTSNLVLPPKISFVQSKEIPKITTAQVQAENVLVSEPSWDKVGEIYPNSLLNQNFMSLYGIDQTWRAATSLALSVVQKRFLNNKNLIVPKLLNFLNFSILDEPPSPPSSNLLLPAKRYENSQKALKDHIKNQLWGMGTTLIQEKLQAHRKQSYIKAIYKANSQTNMIAVDTQLANQTLLSLASADTNKNRFVKPTSVYWYYQNKILQRHRISLNNQWWNGQLIEHSSETLFFSDIDWRYSFITVDPNNDKSNSAATLKSRQSLNRKKSVVETKSTIKQDILIDFPDADQHYNPKNRRWIITSGYWDTWFNFDKQLQTEIFDLLIIESVIASYKILNNNREFLDYSVAKFIKKGLIKEIDYKNLQLKFF